MINLGKLKKIKSNFPVLVAEKAIPKNICKNLTSEISASKAFDDMIMGGRSRTVSYTHLTLPTNREV